ncbi:hypothetical protein BKA61DRAFT_583520 [Leptodontidium sp. MPI-SDFR-AT-0119]|nr:hypothetical protein BKA61DRAFT_583520 [Leptodontidium sp. MPI-SDFR-AT-0119]
MRIREETEKTEALRKAQRALTQAINKSKEALRIKGVQARKNNRANRELLKACRARGDLPSAHLLIPEREPDKHPNALEVLSLTPEGHVEYHHAVIQAQLQVDGIEGEEVSFFTEPTPTKVEVIDHSQYVESSPPPETAVPDYPESSNEESDTGSIDSIARNASFIRF